MDNYPLGAKDDFNAPYNQTEQEDKEIEVTVSLTISKTLKVKVNDYTIEESTDKDGTVFSDIDYSTCNLKEAVEEQILLPNEVAAATKAAIIVNDWKPVKLFKQGLEEADNWIIDDFEVIKE